MFSQGLSELSRRVQKQAQTPRRNERIHSKLEETTYEPITSPARASTPVTTLKQRPKVQDKEASQTSPEIEAVPDCQGRAAKHEEVESGKKKEEEMTAKKSTKAKKSPLTSQKKPKAKEGPKEAERLNASISPIKSAPKPSKDNKDNAGRFSEEVQEFIRRRKLELAQSEDKNLPQDSRKRGLRESVKKEKEKKEPQPRLTPDRSKASIPSVQSPSVKESENEVKKSEKDVENELLERVEGLQFKEVLEVDISEDGTLIYLAAFGSGQEESLKMVGFEEKELAKLGKMLGAELRYDFLKNYLIEAAPKK